MILGLSISSRLRLWIFSSSRSLSLILSGSVGPTKLRWPGLMGEDRLELGAVPGEGCCCCCCCERAEEEIDSIVRGRSRERLLRP